MRDDKTFLKLCRSITPSGFWLGFSLALGMLLSFAVVALAKSSVSTDSVKASTGSTASSLGNTTLSDALSVFKRSSIAADALPSALSSGTAVEMLGNAPSAALSSGSLEPARSRQLLTGLGENNMSLYAIPTDTGDVCTVLTDGPSGCAGPENFADGHADIGVFTRTLGETPVTVYGLILDDVRAVTVMDNQSGRNPAVVGNNAFFVQMGDPKAWPTEVVVRLADGSTETTQLSPAPDLADLTP
jgi:hypothetical protein